MDPYFSPNFLETLTNGGGPIPQYNPLLACPTPPESVSGANTPSPCGVQNVPTSNGPQGENFNCPPIHVSSPGPSSAAVAAPCRYQPSTSYPLSCSLPVGGAEVARRAAARRPQLTSSDCSEASIKILNPKPEYDKVQKKHGPRGKFSEQRIQNGQVCVKWSTVGETNALCDRHHKVSSLIKVHQTPMIRSNVK